MAVELWGPVVGGKASVWFPGEVAAGFCMLPFLPEVDFESAVYAPQIADNFSDANGTALSLHNPIVSSDGWQLMSGEDFSILDGSMVQSVGGTDPSLSIISSFGGITPLEVVTMTGHFADYGEDAFETFVSFTLYAEDSPLADTGFTIYRVDAESGVEVYKNASMSGYGTHSFGPVTAAKCTWVPISIRFDFARVPEYPLLTLTVGDSVDTIELIGEGWNMSNVTRYTIRVQSYNVAPFAFRISELGVIESVV